MKTKNKGVILLLYETINQRIFEVFEKCEIRSFPIDCEGILRQYGFRLCAYEELKNSNPELYCASKTFSDDAFKFRMTVYYNSICNKGRIRFSLMHEFAHYILGHKNKSPEIEDEADYFASCILAPRILIHHLLNKRNAETIHNYFGLSYAASNRALADYKRWLADISSKRIRKPNEPEQKIYELFKTEQKVEKKLHVRKPEASVTSTIRDDLSENAKKQILRNQKERRKIKRQMAQNEKRVQFLEEIGYDFFAAAENEWLYGGL